MSQTPSGIITPSSSANQPINWSHTKWSQYYTSWSLHPLTLIRLLHQTWRLGQMGLSPLNLNRRRNRYLSTRIPRIQQSHLSSIFPISSVCSPSIWLHEKKEKKNICWPTKKMCFFFFSRGVISGVTVFLVFCMLNFRDGPFRRPHPAFWYVPSSQNIYVHIVTHQEEISQADRLGPKLAIFHAAIVPLLDGQILGPRTNPILWPIPRRTASGEELRGALRVYPSKRLARHRYLLSRS